MGQQPAVLTPTPRVSWVPLLRWDRNGFRRTLLRMQGVLQAVALFATVLARVAAPVSDASIEADCRHYFKHAICSEALGRWLPNVPGGEDRTRRTTATAIFDGFRRTPGTTQQSFWAYAPAATPFVHGPAGPPRGTVVYDRRHRIAFYGEGCCSYFVTVLAADVSPPPLAVSVRTLTRVRTDAGIRLGDSPARVMRVYGNAVLQTVPLHPQTRLLMYENAHPPQPGPCAQQQTFAFKNGRLVFIRLFNGC